MQSYWILKGKQAVKQVLTCLKCEGLPYHATTTPDLPAQKMYIFDDPPFTHIYIDFAGPLYQRLVNHQINPKRMMHIYWLFNKSTSP